MNCKLLENKKLIVTGATSGIGKSIALEAASEGADIAFCGLSSEEAIDVIEGIRLKGRKSFFMEVDLTDLDAAKEFVKKSIKFLGKVDGLVNNAGSNCWKGINHTNLSDLNNCMSLNFYAPFVISQECYPFMKKNGDGIVVNIASIHADFTLPGVFPYNATKAALVALTKSQALEWASENIRSFSVNPALTQTSALDMYLGKFKSPEKEMNRLINNYPLKKAGLPKDVASLVIFLLSGQSAFMTGNSIRIDGGISCTLEPYD